MIARVSLEIALRREFDYAIPPELAGNHVVLANAAVNFLSIPCDGAQGGFQMHAQLFAFRVCGLARHGDGLRK